MDGMVDVYTCCMPDDHKWYYEKQGAFLGPIDAETMRDIIRSGGLTGATLVWRDGIIGRQPIVTIPELAAYLPESSAAEGHVSASATPAAVQPVTVAHARTSPPASGLAISSLVLGILSLALFCLVPISLACGIIGLALGLSANRGSNKEPMAIAGIVTSIVGVLLGGLLLLGIVGENREKGNVGGFEDFFNEQDDVGQDEELEEDREKIKERLKKVFGEGGEEDKGEAAGEGEVDGEIGDAENPFEVKPE